MPYFTSTLTFAKRVENDRRSLVGFTFLEKLPRDPNNQSRRVKGHFTNYIQSLRRLCTNPKQVLLPLSVTVTTSIQFIKKYFFSVPGVPSTTQMCFSNSVYQAEMGSLRPPEPLSQHRGVPVTRTSEVGDLGLCQVIQVLQITWVLRQISTFILFNFR